MRAREDRGECGASLGTWPAGAGWPVRQPPQGDPSAVTAGASFQCTMCRLGPGMSHSLTIYLSSNLLQRTSSFCSLKRKLSPIFFRFLGPLVRQLPSLWVECLSKVARAGKSCITHMDQWVGGERALTRPDQSQSWERGLDRGQGRRAIQIPGMRSGHLRRAGIVPFISFNYLEKPG